MAEPTVAAAPAPPAERRAPAAPEFPGCRPVRIARHEIADCERRLEYWDAATETAMVCEPTGYYHESPIHLLTTLTGKIAEARGLPIKSVGTTDLLLRDARGEWQRIMQADQILYLHPAQARPRGDAIEVGADTLPDVVLEVDNTTDVRRGKLELYDSWGFPEVWVEVPDRPAPSRPAALRAGLTIYVRGGGRLRPAAVSRAFPGWTAAEIHRALNEPELSDETAAVLDRVGRLLGAAAGTRPHDDPFLRRHLRRSRAEGHAEGRLTERVDVIESLVRAGMPWPAIESATGIDTDVLRALKQRLAASSAAPEPTEAPPTAEDTE